LRVQEQVVKGCYSFSHRKGFSLWIVNLQMWSPS
jgi:hypothetical protein